MPASDVLADSTRVGDAYFMAIGPAVIFLAVIGWVLLTLLAARRPPRSRGRTGGGLPRGLPNRGPVQGGIIAGSPSQRSRRDPIVPESEAEPVIEARHDVKVRRRARRRGARLRKPG